MACRSAGPGGPGCPAASGCGLDTSRQSGSSVSSTPVNVKRPTVDGMIRGGPDGGRAAELEGSVADEDRTRAGSGAGDAPPKHRPRAVTSGMTRGVLRRRPSAAATLGGGGCRRTRLPGGVGLYLGSRSGPGAGDGQGGPPAMRPRAPPVPPVSPATDGRTGEAGPATPGPASAPAPTLARARRRRPAHPPRRRQARFRRRCRSPRERCPPIVDLTAVGARDWVHWGERGGTSTVRKRSGSGEIVDEGGAGRRVGWDGQPGVRPLVRRHAGSGRRTTAPTASTPAAPATVSASPSPAAASRARSSSTAASGWPGGDWTRGCPPADPPAPPTGGPVHRSERPVHRPLHGAEGRPTAAELDRREGLHTALRQRRPPGRGGALTD